MDVASLPSGTGEHGALVVQAPLEDVGHGVGTVWEDDVLIFDGPEVPTWDCRPLRCGGEENIGRPELIVPLDSEDDLAESGVRGVRRGGEAVHGLDDLHVAARVLVHDQGVVEVEVSRALRHVQGRKLRGKPGCVGVLDGGPELGGELVKALLLGDRNVTASDDGLRSGQRHRLGQRTFGGGIVLSAHDHKFVHWEMEGVSGEREKKKQRAAANQEGRAPHSRS